MGLVFLGSIIVERVDMCNFGLGKWAWRSIEDGTSLHSLLAGFITWRIHYWSGFPVKANKWWPKEHEDLEAVRELSKA